MNIYDNVPHSTLGLCRECQNLVNLYSTDQTEIQKYILKEHKVEPYDTKCNGSLKHPSNVYKYVTDNPVY